MNTKARADLQSKLTGRDTPTSPGRSKGRELEAGGGTAIRFSLTGREGTWRTWDLALGLSFPSFFPGSARSQTGVRSGLARRPPGLPEPSLPGAPWPYSRLCVYKICLGDFHSHQKCLRDLGLTDIFNGLLFKFYVNLRYEG